MTYKVAIIMGSASDYPIMKEAELILKDFGIPTHVEVVSAHRTPEKMVAFAKAAKSNGINVIIAGAGGAARWLSAGSGSHRLVHERSQLHTLPAS